MKNIVTNRNPEPSGQQVARQMLDEGLCPIPVGFKSKKPIVGNWQKLTREEVSAQFDKLFPEGQNLNVGCLHGKPSGNVIDLDFDWPEARDLAHHFLPPTKVFGRASARSSHWLYRVDEVPTIEKFRPPEPPSVLCKPDILEVRGNGHQTVWPGSIHESGEVIEWESDVPITEISYGKLRPAIQQLVAASWLCTVWGKGNSRDELANALAGGMLRDGNDAEVVKHFLETVMVQCDDEEIGARLDKVERSDEIINGEREGLNFGWPKVAELLGQKVADWLRKLLKPSQADQAKDHGADSGVVREMLERLAVVKHGCQTFILYPERDVLLSQFGEQRTRFDLMRASELATFYANRQVMVPGNRSTRLVNPVDLFLKHPDRKTYQGITFAPDGNCPDGYLNLWQGFAVTPSEGDCSLYLSHVRDNIAAGNEEHYRWIIGWMADAIQNPSAKPGTSLVLRGGRGTGKGMMVKWFGWLFGQHFLPISKPGLITGRFTGHLMDASILFADEAFFAGNHAEAAALKALITEEFHMIEHKGKDAVTVRNLIRLVAASNSDWVVPAGLDERRFAVFDVAGTRQQDRTYFGAIEKQMETGGLAALLHHLLHFDLSAVDVGKAPDTGALAENKLLTAEPMVKWWYDILHEGQLILTGPMLAQTFVRLDAPVWVRTRDLWKTYREYARDHKYCQAKDSQVIFGTQWKRLCPGAKYGKHRFDGSPERGYRIPPLEQCIDEFVKVTGIPITIPDELEDDDGTATAENIEF
jgi:hypothetical protein